MIDEVPERQLVEVRVKLPKDLVEWLERIARARGENIDNVLTWTLGILRNFYDRWFYTISNISYTQSRLKTKQLHSRQNI